MEFMLQCRKFCPEITMSRVANSGARTGMPSSERHTLGSKGEERDLTDKTRLPWPSLLHEHTSKANYHPSRSHRHNGPSEPEKCRGQGAATQAVRQYGKELQRRHRHFLRPASPARCCQIFKFSSALRLQRKADLVGAGPISACASSGNIVDVACGGVG